MYEIPLKRPAIACRILPTVPFRRGANRKAAASPPQIRNDAAHGAASDLDGSAMKRSGNTSVAIMTIDPTRTPIAEVLLPVSQSTA